MPALTNRAEARARALQAFQAALDEMIPADESVPLKGGTFGEFEDQIERMAQATLPTVLEERAALEETAEVGTGGCCPRCGSDRVYLKKERPDTERQSPHGKVVLREQRARCRACGSSFSPSSP